MSNETIARRVPRVNVASCDGRVFVPSSYVRVNVDLMAFS